MNEAPSNKEEKDNTVTSGFAITAAAALVAFGGKAAYDHFHQETGEENPTTTIQIPLEKQTKQSIMNEIIHDDTRVKLLEALLKGGAPTELLEDSNDSGDQAMEFSKVMLEDFLRTHKEAGTVPDAEALQAEIDRLKTKMTEFRARRDVLDAVERASR